MVAEKPSVAAAIANVLGAQMKALGCYIGNGYVVSWCIGHLLELSEPERYDPKYKRWSKEHLPIIPEKWVYDVSEKSRAQYEVLREWLNHPDVETVICATDAGREGEHIFRLVYEQSGCTLPVKRLWISSLEEQAIRDGFRNLRDSNDYDNLYQAALCRSRADWLVGMNASRLYSLLYGQNLKIGRVLTPTLALITNKEQAIAGFKPEAIYHVVLSCDLPGGELVARSKRINTKEEAECIRAVCHNKAAVVKSIERTSHADKPPLLYDLTTLQRDANRIYGYTAQQTLDYIQKLYEKRLTTYPRTDSRYLTSDMAAGLPELVQRAASCLPFVSGLDLSVHPERVICDAKVSDHHAIIPTRCSPREQLAKLLAGERNIFSLIAVRLVCAVSDDYRYDRITVTLECEGHSFTLTGKVSTQEGWLVPNSYFHDGLNSPDTKAKDTEIPDLTIGQVIESVKASVKVGSTTKPVRYTEDRLLAAMETAGMEDMPEEAERKGIGTSATRAGILEKLVSSDLVERQGDHKAQYLVPTEKGKMLIQVLPETLTSPLLTAEWEQRLLAIERGEASAEKFMQDVNAMLEDMVANAKPVAGVTFPSTYRELGVCPACGCKVIEKSKGAFCSNETCRFSLWWDHWFFTSKRLEITPELISALLKDGYVDCDKMWSPTKQKTYAGRAVMTVAEDGKPFFSLQFPDQKNGA